MDLDNGIRERTQAFEKRCYRRLLNISYKDHVINDEVRRKISAIGKYMYDELLTLVKKRKVRWFGHVSRSSGLAKTILQGSVKVVVVVLLFYLHGKHLWSCRDGQLT